MNPQPVALLQIRHLGNGQLLACAAHSHFNPRTGQVEGSRVGISRGREQKDEEKQTHEYQTQNHIPILEAN